jgi:Ca-activated chloride channel family protein
MAGFRPSATSASAGRSGKRIAIFPNGMVCLAARQRGRTFFVTLAGLAILAALPPAHGRQDPQLRFQAGIDLVSVSATVTDAEGRFVRNLTRDDFMVYEDGAPQALSHFSSERVPVSLGLALDTSGSMTGEKIRAAQAALRRFLVDLLGPDDEVFLYRFSDAPVLVAGWMNDRARLGRLLGQITPNGETVLYDTIGAAVPLAQTGRHRKKALVIISDGNDTGSRTSLRDVRQRILESEVLVYAVGIDSQTADRPAKDPGRRWPPIRIPGRLPGGPRVPGLPQPGVPVPQPPTSDGTWNPESRVNGSALRELTDDSGGRTEIVRSARDLDAATAGIADELSRQYFLAYPSPARRDGRWHDIRVEVRRHDCHVRARRGYVAS